VLTNNLTADPHPLVKLQASITEFTKAGGLQAVEERLIAVQDYEAKLDELDRLAETYRVGVAALLLGGGALPVTSLGCIHVLGEDRHACRQLHP
jgi:hypothetical protein